jgi:hypothetical protein
VLLFIIIVLTLYKFLLCQCVYSLCSNSYKGQVMTEFETWIVKPSCDVQFMKSHIGLCMR